jgi:hypothetical protein
MSRVPERSRSRHAKEEDMRYIYDGRHLAAAWAQLGRAFEVLVARQYFAPWNQLASRDCRDC